MSTARINISKSIAARVAVNIRQELTTTFPTCKFKVLSKLTSRNMTIIYIKWDWTLPIQKANISNIVLKYGKKHGGLIDIIMFDHYKKFDPVGGSNI